MKNNLLIARALAMGRLRHESNGGSRSENDILYSHRLSLPLDNMYVLDELLPAAADKRESTLLRTLLDAGANPIIKTKSGETPLHLVAIAPFGRVNVDMTKTLPAKGANPDILDRAGYAPLHHLAFKQDGGLSVAMAAALTEAGADPNGKGRFGMTPLH